VRANNRIANSLLWGLSKEARRVAFLLILGVMAPLGMAQKPAEGNTETLRSRQRFQLSATLLDKTSKTRTVQLSARQWDVLGNKRIARFPEHGFLLVQLVGGRVTTIIDGKQQKRQHGEFWTVPANSQMSVIAAGEDATLQVISFTNP
jgi:quercetin dioxygenase-like cupin family protein